jgi:hypothetical protein
MEKIANAGNTQGRPHPGHRMEPIQSQQAGTYPLAMTNGCVAMLSCACGIHAESGGAGTMGPANRPSNS